MRIGALAVITNYIKKHDHQLLTLTIGVTGITRGVTLMVPGWTTAAVYAGYSAFLPVQFWGMILTIGSIGLLLFLYNNTLALGAGSSFLVMFLWFWQAYQAALASSPPGAAVLMSIGLGSAVVYAKIRRGD